MITKEPIIIFKVNKSHPRTVDKIIDGAKIVIPCIPYLVIVQAHNSTKILVTIQNNLENYIGVIGHTSIENGLASFVAWFKKYYNH